MGKITNKKTPTKAQITRGALHEKQAIDLLREKHEENGSIVLPQVRNGTGNTRATRTADALIIETWSSRGIGFTGVEYKRDRSDWLAELKNPAKAEEIGKYCKYWVILAPVGLIELAELPELWGLWEIHDNKHIKVAHRPPLQKYIQPTVEFVCSILRSNRNYDPVRQHDWNLEMGIRKRIEGEFQGRNDRVKKELNDIRQKIYKFEQETGLTLGWDIEKSIKVAPKLLHHFQYPDQIHAALEKTRKELAGALELIEKIAAERVKVAVLNE